MTKSKQEVKQAAKQSASAGSLSNKQINQLKDAGVKSSVISNIKTTNTQAKTSNTGAKTPTSQNNTANKTPNAITDGRYGIGAQRAAKENYRELKDQGVTDAFNPGKPGSRMNIMADGFVGKKELNKFASLKDIDASQARKRLSSKGAAFTAGANKRADRVFGKNNPFLSMMIGANDGERGLIAAAQPGGKARQMQIFQDSRGYDYKNRLPDEVFQFRPNGGIQGDRPLPNVERLNQIFGNPIVGEKPPGDTTDTGNNPPPEGVVTAAPPPPEEKPEDPMAGMMAGGGLGAAGASKLGRARSRLQRLGILGRGTGLLGRGLQYGNTLNA